MLMRMLQSTGIWLVPLQRGRCRNICQQLAHAGPVWQSAAHNGMLWLLLLLSYALARLHLLGAAAFCAVQGQFRVVQLVLLQAETEGQNVKGKRN